MLNCIDRYKLQIFLILENNSKLSFIHILILSVIFISFNSLLSGKYLLATYFCLFAQSCPTLCGPMDCSLSYSSVHGILRQEHWSGDPCLPPGDRPDPGIEPASHCRQILYPLKQLLFKVNFK